MTCTDPMFDEMDLDEPDYRCVHGTFIGNPNGADYMCGYCESGDEPPTREEIVEASIRMLERADAEYERIMASLRSSEHAHRFGNWPELHLAVFDGMFTRSLELAARNVHDWTGTNWEES
jgi:hypothetical protein